MSASRRRARGDREGAGETKPVLPGPPERDGERRVTLMVVLRAKHLKALDGEAVRRAGQDPAFLAGRRGLRPDRSALLREIVDEWIARRRR